MNNRVVTFFRAILTVAVFDKTLRLSRGELEKSAVATLINTDVSSMEYVISMFQDFWGSIVEVGLGVCILFTILGPAALSVLIPALCEYTLLFSRPVSFAKQRRLQ